MRFRLTVSAASTSVSSTGVMVRVCDSPPLAVKTSSVAERVKSEPSVADPAEWTCTVASAARESCTSTVMAPFVSAIAAWVGALNVMAGVVEIVVTEEVLESALTQAPAPTARTRQ